MATVGLIPRASDGQACPASPWRGPALLALAAIGCALLLAGCAAKSPQLEAGQQPAGKPVTVQPRIHRPSRVLLVPQPAPDCELKASGLKPVDPDQFERLKLDYERECYKNAEKLVRERLRRLQAAFT